MYLSPEVVTVCSPQLEIVCSHREVALQALLKHSVQETETKTFSYTGTSLRATMIIMINNMITAMHTIVTCKQLNKVVANNVQSVIL